MLESVKELRKLIEQLRNEYVNGNVSYNVEFNGIADTIEREVDEGYVELPRDSEGIPIRPNDEIVVHHPKLDPQVSTVTALILTDRWDFEQSCYETDSRDVNDLSDFYENVKHFKIDPWERIIEGVVWKAMEWAARYEGEVTDPDFYDECAHAVDKLRQADTSTGLNDALGHEDKILTCGGLAEAMAGRLEECFIRCKDCKFAIELCDGTYDCTGPLVAFLPSRETKTSESHGS